ncbi:hypothetical protein RAB80_010015 [Fusarium oxysporum f. sp. vasinfectum]|uniref:Uncharacterized protein n=1 Tax=Fusarium oxysporum f. sp. vasinfectum 25433 TaxID=1089449 RepID=X0LJU8_FUSOX|nr:hypothetical protein FOTG_10682 [Fusarium oxysporum f. sp. vasinfectum 25433]KAK2675031.1 hypothetical protein RAB80_010015 [Fusarium oxysporum f. sp. vasinfectum]KAK2931463.1 hypothetical protein FoTM2_008973 [Fusarium oxysporum f. sp. vasinfectum]
MATVSEIIRALWKPPRSPGIRLEKDRLDRTLPENFTCYKQWGFNIYRTYYGKGSNKHWAKLLDALKRQTYLALRYLEQDSEYEIDSRNRKFGIYDHPNKEDYMEDLERLRKLFHLEVRQDPNLEGLDIHQVRKICAEEHNQGKVITAGVRVHYVLVADEAVLRDISQGEFIVKAVSYRWDRSKNWGWMRIPTGYLLEFWQSLVISNEIDQDTVWFLGPEEELEKCIWPGEDSVSQTGRCSEVRPGLYHYSGQALWHKSEELRKARAARRRELSRTIQAQP